MPPLWLTVKTKLTAKQIPILPEHYQGSWLVTMSPLLTAGLPCETVAGGPYAISAVLSPSGVLANYNITNTPAQLTIGKIPASVTPTAAQKVYGSSDPALTGNLSGFLAADNITATYSRTQGESVGASPYTISAVLTPAAALGNYEITYNTAAFAITAKDASVVVDSKNKAYGQADPDLTGTLSGFLAGDNVTAAYSRAPGETVAGGPYAISAVLSPSGVLANYNITNTPAQLTIGKIPASVTPTAAQKVYGSSDPALTGNLSGFLAADNITATYSRTQGESVGASPYTISAVLTPAAALGNYEITYNTAAFAITSRSVTIKADDLFKECAAANDPALTYSITSGSLVNDDTFNGQLVRNPGEGLGTYAINQGSLALSANYAMTFVSGTLTISDNTVPHAVARDFTVQLDASGNASITVDQVE